MNKILIEYILELDLNDPESLFRMAQYYETNKDYDKMIKYYEISSFLGHIKSMYNLGYHYQFIEKNENLMIKYYKMAIDNNDVLSMINLGYYYFVIYKDYNKMFKYYKMAIENKNSKMIIINEKSKILDNFKLYYKNMIENTLEETNQPIQSNQSNQSNKIDTSDIEQIHNNLINNKEYSILYERCSNIWNNFFENVFSSK